MATPSLDYSWYADEHYGIGDEDGFNRALPLAVARLTAITGSHVPERCEDAWRHAACALADRVSGVDLGAGAVSSEHVGETTVTYSEAYTASAGASDYDLVRPWLAGTGLLASCLDSGRRF